MMNDFSFIIFLTSIQLYCETYFCFPRKYFSEPRIFVWRCGEGFFLCAQFPPDHGRGMLFFPHGLDAENENANPTFLYAGIFPEIISGSSP